MAEGISTDINGDNMQFSVSSLDDFTHLSVDKYMTSSFTKSQYNQVIFHDLSDIYPTDGDIKCTYSLTDNVKPQAGDKVAIFKVGWVSVSDYITFERARVSENLDSSIFEVTFKAGTFIKKDNELYQLCYVTSGNVIAGASTPFSFQKPHESEFVAIEDPNDPGLVVFRSRVAQLQNELDKKNEEIRSLISKYDLSEDRFKIIKNEFDNNEEELNKSREKNSELTLKQQQLMIEKSSLEDLLNKCSSEFSEIKKEYEILSQKYAASVDENQITSKKIEDLDTERNAFQESCQGLEDQLKRVQTESCQNAAELNKYKMEMSLLKEQFKQLHCENEALLEKLENEEMKSLADTFGDVNEISQEEVQEIKNELERQKMIVQSLTADKERQETKITEQSYANDNLMLEVGNLKFRLKELSEKHNKATAEAHIQLREASEKHGNLKNELTQLVKVLNEREKGVEYLKCRDERDLYNAQFLNLQLHHSKCERKLDVQLEGLRTQHEIEKQTLVSQNNELLKKIKHLENSSSTSSQSTGQNTPNAGFFKDPASQLYEVFSDACSHVSSVLDGKTSSQKQKQNQPDTNSNENEKQLMEKIKILLNQKAEISENLVQEKHRTGELERICVLTKEENAALKSRINVLEYELATVKNSSGFVPPISSPAQTLITEQLDSLNKSLPLIKQFNDIVAEQKVLEQKIQEEKTAKIFLQSKVEFLLSEDAKMSNKLKEVILNYEEVCKEKEELTKSVNAENVEILQKVLEDNDILIDKLKRQLDETLKQRERLEKTVNDLRKELVGKISVDSIGGYKTKIATLEKELQKKKQDLKFMAKFIQERFKDNNQRSISCPICPSEFPSTSREAFVQHFDGHLF